MPAPSPSSGAWESLKTIIESRRTEKVLLDEGEEREWNREQLGIVDEQVMKVVLAANWAPFHYPGCFEGYSEPWRVVWLKRDACEQIASSLRDWVPDLKPTHKFPGLFGATGSCLVVTWRPESRLTDSAKQEQVNREHLLAVGAFVQNILLGLTACGLGSYWASGGVLAHANVGWRYGLMADEEIAAVLFVDYLPAEGAAGVKRVAGKLRDERSQDSAWLDVLEQVVSATGADGEKGV